MNTVTKFIGARTGIGKNMKKEFLKLFAVTLIGLALLNCQGAMGPQGPAGEDGRDGDDGKDGKPGVTVILGEGFRDAIEWINEVDENDNTVRKQRLMSGGGWTEESTATNTTLGNRQQFSDTIAKYFLINPNATKEDYIENNKVVNGRWITFTLPTSNIRGA
ncbi:MAG: hypothetical protein FWD87_11310 [Spirochaetaceae bacterium]|nr:hypothetical protein [Spirochaetaceae bacterium]